MKGQDFYNDIKHVLKRQSQQESSIDFDQLLKLAGGKDEITPSHSGNELDEFFVDPTLFSLLRQYNEGGDDKPTTSRRQPSLQQDENTIIKKPQAKDVLPKRVLNEEENNAYEQQQSKRVRHEASSSTITNTNDDNNTFSTTSIDETTTSMTMQNDNTPSPTTNDTNNSEPPFEQIHPDIPATSISKKFMDMANLLEQSPLRTIKRIHLMDVPPRIKQPLNYAHHSWDNNNLIDKKQKSTTTNNNSNNNNNTSSKILLPILKPNSNDDGELIFTFSIYQSHSPSKKLQEFHVLGSQTLTDLRDALYCRMDFSTHGDRMNNQQDGELINTFRQKRSPSYFYIDGIFYVDQRLQATDLSEYTRNWLEQRQQPSTTVIPMDQLALRDLPLQLNTPYMFDHQQHCQHLVMVRDIRLLESRDKRQPEYYPIVTYSWRYRRYKCNMCMIYPAVYVTTNDYLSGYSPCFFCERCYEPFHFDKAGNAVTTFDVCAYHGT